MKVVGKVLEGDFYPCDFCDPRNSAKRADFFVKEKGSRTCLHVCRDCFKAGRPEVIRAEITKAAKQHPEMLAELVADYRIKNGRLDPALRGAFIRKAQKSLADLVR